jgi:hypothetical protein
LDHGTVGILLAGLAATTEVHGVANGAQGRLRMLGRRVELQLENCIRFRREERA